MIVDDTENDVKTMRVVDSVGLGKDGFTIIRNLLQGRTSSFRWMCPWRKGPTPGAVRAACELADVLHNLPADTDDVFVHDLTGLPDDGMMKEGKRDE